VETARHIVWHMSMRTHPALFCPLSRRFVTNVPAVNLYGQTWLASYVEAQACKSCIPMRLPHFRHLLCPADRVRRCALASSRCVVLQGGCTYEVKFRTNQLEHRFGCPYQIGHHACSDKVTCWNEVPPRAGSSPETVAGHKVAAVCMHSHWRAHLHVLRGWGLGRAASWLIVCMHSRARGLCGCLPGRALALHTHARN